MHELLLIVVDGFLETVLIYSRAITKNDRIL